MAGAPTSQDSRIIREGVGTLPPTFALPAFPGTVYRADPWDSFVQWREVGGSWVPTLWVVLQSQTPKGWRNGRRATLSELQCLLRL